MNSTKDFDLARIWADASSELKGAGILCAVNRAGKISTHSAGTIGENEHAKPFYIYSITKTFTATAILLLCEQEDFFLDRSLSNLLPEAPVSREITVRQLLNHTSGLSDYFFSTEYRDAVRSHPESPWPYERLMRVGLEQTPLFAPGCGWSYSNSGYALLNELIEKLSGMRFYAFYERCILAPLGLVDTRPFLEIAYAGRLLPGGGYLNGRRFPSTLRTWLDPARMFDLDSDGPSAISACTFLRRAAGLGITCTNEANCGCARINYRTDHPCLWTGVMHDRNDPLGAAYGHRGNGPGYATYTKCYPSLGGAPFSLSLVVNRSLPATSFELVDRMIKSFLDHSTE